MSASAAPRRAILRRIFLEALGRLGYACTLIEASGWPGGCCLTLRGGDQVQEYGGVQRVLWHREEHLYANMGPARIPHHHKMLLGCCKGFDVPLEVFVNENRAAFVHDTQAFGGKPVQNRHVGRGHVYQGASRASYSVTPGVGLVEGVLRERASLQDLLKTESTQANLSFTEEWNQAATLLQPVGGMDRIVQAFVRQVGDRITCHAPVEAVRKAGDGARTVCRHEGVQKVLEVDHAVVTLPFAPPAEDRDRLLRRPQGRHEELPLHAGGQDRLPARRTAAPGRRPGQPLARVARGVHPVRPRGGGRHRATHCRAAARLNFIKKAFMPFTKPAPLGVGIQYNPEILDWFPFEALEGDVYEVLLDNIMAPLDGPQLIKPASRKAIERLRCKCRLLAHSNYGCEFGFGPLERTPAVQRHIGLAPVVAIHLAGGSWFGGLYHDWHDTRVPGTGGDADMIHKALAHARSYRKQPAVAGTEALS